MTGAVSGAVIAAAAVTTEAWRTGVLPLLGLVALSRLLEMFASALRLRAHRARGVAPVPEPWWAAMVALHVLVLGGAIATVLVSDTPPPRIVLWIALGALSVATALRGWLYLTLGARWNARVVDPGSIVTHGPYRFIRHPNYLAVILEVAALPLLAGAYWLAVLGTIANALVLSLRIPLEEETLAARHRAYREVLLRRPRFIPR